MFESFLGVKFFFHSPLLRPSYTHFAFTCLALAHCIDALVGFVNKRQKTVTLAILRISTTYTFFLSELQRPCPYSNYYEEAKTHNDLSYFTCCCPLLLTTTSIRYNTCCSLLVLLWFLFFSPPFCQHNTTRRFIYLFFFLHRHRRGCRNCCHPLCLFEY